MKVLTLFFLVPDTVPSLVDSLFWTCNCSVYTGMSVHATSCWSVWASATPNPMWTLFHILFSSKLKSRLFSSVFLTKLLMQPAVSSRKSFDTSFDWKCLPLYLDLLPSLGGELCMVGIPRVLFEIIHLTALCFVSASCSICIIWF
jgi:hypothetical protein